MHRLTFHQQLLLLLCSILLLCTAFSGLAIYHINDTNKIKNSDVIGNLLTKQTAIAARDIILTKDRLSLHILLNELIKSPAISHAVIMNNDLQTLAVATDEGTIIINQKRLQYEADILHQGKTIGYIKIQISDQLNRNILTGSLKNIILCGLLMLVISYVLILRFSQTRNSLLANTYNKLTQLCRINNVPLKPIKDELMYLNQHVSALHKQYRSQFKHEMKKNDHNSALVAFRVNNLHPLKRQLDTSVIQKKLDAQLAQFEEASALYSGDIYYASEGSGYIKFNKNTDNENALNAACCARLIEHLISNQKGAPLLDIRLGLSFDKGSLAGKTSSPVIPDSTAGKALIHAFTQQQGIVIEPRVHEILNRGIIKVNIDHSGNYIINRLSERYELIVSKQCQKIINPGKTTPLAMKG